MNHKFDVIESDYLAVFTLLSDYSSTPNTLYFMISGVYAGDPSKLSMKAAFGKVWKLEQNGGSIIGGTFKAIQERKKAPKAERDP